MGRKVKTSRAPILWERQPNGKWHASMTVKITAHVEDADIADADNIIRYMLAVDALVTGFGKAALKKVQQISEAQ